MNRVGVSRVIGSASGATNSGYYGTGEDGEYILTSPGTVSIPVAESGQVFKQFTSVQIDQGVTVTTETRCNGMIWLVQGDFILNGTISMDKRAPLLNDREAECAKQRHIILCGSLTGGSGGTAGVGNVWNRNGNSETWSYFSKSPGVGGLGFLFGGGYGGGSSSESFRGGSCDPRPPIGTQIPYPASTDGDSLFGAGAPGSRSGGIGGAGPGGSAGLYMYYSSAAYVNGNPGESIGGGALWIFVQGQVRIGSTGLITACGGNAGNGSWGNKRGSGGADGEESQFAGGGGGGGGGIICLIHNGDFVNSGTIVANGGKGGLRGAYDRDYRYNHSTNGEDGGLGAVKIDTLSHLLGI